MTHETWRRRVRRAVDLSAVDAPSRALVVFYAALLQAQENLYDHLNTHSDWRPCGALSRDSEGFRPQMAIILHAVTNAGPEPLAIEARRLLGAGEREIDEMLLQYLARAVRPPVLCQSNPPALRAMACRTWHCAGRPRAFAR